MIPHSGVKEKNVHPNTAYAATACSVPPQASSHICNWLASGMLYQWQTSQSADVIGNLTYFLLFDNLNIENNPLFMRKITLKNVVWKEGKHYVSQCLNVDVASFGKSKKDALEKLDEALELYFEDVKVPKVSRVERPEIFSLLLHHA